MGLTTNFNQNPYWDDFSESKNFHRVLFKPAVAVQARELTQLQSILQNQIERFGENVIKEGSIVKGGNFVEVNPLPYVKILDRVIDADDNVVGTVEVQNFLGLKAVGQDSGIEAIVIEALSGNQTTTENTKTIFVKYLNNNQVAGVNRGVFDDSEEIFLVDSSDERVFTVTAGGGVIVGDTPAVGNGYGVRCGDGVLFQKGHFVRFDDDLTIVSRYTTTPSDIVVGFQTVESIVDSNADETLLDNAQGYNNENAPGADRLLLTPVLTAKSTTEAKADPRFFSLQEYQNGRISRRRLTTQFNSIEKLVEKRTSEESGNYTVNDFKIKMEQSTSNTSMLAVNISPGIAYVEGKRVEVVNNFNIEIEEPTTDDAVTVDNQTIATNYGQYVLTASASGLLFDIDSMEEVQLYSGASLMGAARVRNITRQVDGKHRIYLFAIEIADGYQFSDLDRIKSSTSATDGNVAITDTTLYDYNFRGAVYPIGRDFIKSIDPTSSYTYRSVASVTVDGSNNATISISDDFPYGAGQTLNSDQLLDFVVVRNDNLGEVIDVISGSTTSSSSVSLVLDTASVDVDVYYNAVKTGTGTKNEKTLGTYYVKLDTSALGNDGPYCLGMSDIYSLEEVTYGANNVTSSFRLDNGQKDSYYGLGYIRKIDSTNFGGATLTVKVKAFTHSDGSSYFCADSYPVDDTTTVLPANKIRTENIPAYTSESGNTIYLRDVIDFRPVAANTVTLSTTSGGATTVNGASFEALAFDGASINFPAPNKTLLLTYDYNVGRYDRLIIDENGEFNVLTGALADDPSVPAEPNKGMSVAILKITPFPSIPASVANRAGKPDYGIGVVSSKNKRYTMKDIGKIESRIKTLEYYTSLNLLEKSTKDLVITDANGVDRFKNGIMVDNFENLSIARTTSPEFSAAVDPSFKELMPRFRSYPITLKPTGSGSNYTDYGIAATLSKTDVAVIEQTYATNVKSCTTDFYKYNGAMTIYPEYDSAPDVTRAPDINIEIDLATPFMEFTEALSEFVPLQNVTQEIVDSVTTRSGGFLGFFRRRNTTETIATTTETMSVTEGTTDTQGLGDFVTDLQFEPFLRSKDIEIHVTGLRPNTRFYFFFDGKDVNEHVAGGVQITSGSETFVAPNTEFGSATVLSDADGVLDAVFRIPSGTFFVGDRLLEMFDLPSYSDKEAATSYASHNYSGFNFSVEKTGMTVSTRQPRIEVLSDTVFTTRTRRGGSDPIAQTFAFDRDQSNDTSVMITKVDLYFAQKSATNNGVTVAIVETTNGYPTGKIVPFSQVHIKKDDINANIDSAILATTVNFNAPVSLKTDTEYALVIAPDANDPDYFVWISRTGGTDVDTGEAVTQDTNAGVLFTSTNAKAWTPYQDENLKFNMYRAEFTDTTGYIELTTNDVEFLRIDSVTGTFTEGERVYANSTNLTGTVSGTAGSYTITGSGTVFQDEIGVGDYVKIASETRVHKVSTITSQTEITLETPLINSISANTYFNSVVGKVVYQTTTSPQTLVLEESSARYVDGVSGDILFATGTTIVGEKSGISASIDEIVDQKISYMQPSIFRSNFTQTSTVAEMTSPFAKKIDFNTNNYMTNDSLVVKSKSNEVSEGAAINDFKMRVNMQTIASDITATSPLIDYDISNVMVYEYLINNPSPTNENTFSGDASTKYISRTVELKDGLDAEELKVFLTAYRPTNANIEVYARIQSQYDNRSTDFIEWTPLVVKPETDKYSSLSNRYDYRELEYGLSTTAKAAGEGAWLDTASDTIRYIADNGSEYNDFKMFAIKIVLLSDNHYEVPRVRDLRALALS